MSSTSRTPWPSRDAPQSCTACQIDGCLACHNPYTINPCDDCGACLPACTSGALSFDADGRVRWDADRCVGTEACLAACPRDSTPKARTLAVTALLERVSPVAPFLSGVTVSGGEASRQALFVRAFFTALRADPGLARLTRFLDTNGDMHLPVWQVLEPSLDAAMVDLKCLDNDLHRVLTGADNDRVLRSIRLFAERGKLYEVRLLLMAGLNDGDDLLARTGAWLAGVDPRMRVKLIGYRAHGVRPRRAGTGPDLREPDGEQRAHYADVLRREGDFELVVV